jgi:glycosyltransferase involved in cell wall biosynthesis
VQVIVNAWRASGDVLGRDAARARLALPKSAFCVGWVGRLTHEKGADVLLEAVDELPPGAIVSFIGDGKQRPGLEARARALGVAARVRWHGIVPDASTLLKAFDAFVLSSRSEGTPIVLFEAMGAGVPIVATRVGGIPDVISDEHALLVSPNDPSAIAGAVRRIHEESMAARQRAATATTRLRDDFAVVPWLAAYEGAYRQIVRSRVRTGAS